MMRRIVRAGATALALLAGIGAAEAQDVPITLRPGEVLLQVQTEGTHEDRPDLMSLTVGVVTEGATTAAALGANSERIQQLIAAIRTIGLAPRDIRTNELRLMPLRAPRPGGSRDDDDYDRDDTDRPITGYRASNMLQIRLRDLTRSGALVQSLLQAGATNIEGPTFSLSDPSAARTAARQDAARRAREEADTYAAALGLRVARVLRISERGDFRASSSSDIVVTARRREERVEPIEPGEIETQVNLWIDFALEPTQR